MASLFFSVSFQNWMDHGNLKDLSAIDLDSSDNLSEDALGKFVSLFGPQLKGVCLSGKREGDRNAQ